jgi:hypothetical protein
MNVLPCLQLQSVLLEFCQYIVIIIFAAFSIAILTSKTLGSGTSSSAVIHSP